MQDVWRLTLRRIRWVAYGGLYSQTIEQFLPTVRWIQINVLLLYRPPETFKEDSMESSAFSINAYLSFLVSRCTCPFLTRELRTLNRVRDERTAVSLTRAAIDARTSRCVH